MLQYNKLYQSLKKVTAEWHAGHVEYSFYWDFMRFYDDGTVISCNNNSNQSLNNWFYRENRDAYFNRGTFEKKNNIISLRIPVAAGVLEYEGQIQPDKLVLFVENNVTKYRSVDYFELIDLIDK
ncbi:MAG: hypothetical protein RIC30_08715 [Marinoscillum sp.]|uniref:hypothetical protein n=1 Tax=Marinoscillum sp. TaxID=2024838 RepID=UPI0032F0E3E5